MRWSTWTRPLSPTTRPVLRWPRASPAEPFAVCPQRLRLSLDGGHLFEALSPEGLDHKVLKVVKSVEQELTDRAVAAYKGLAHGR